MKSLRFVFPAVAVVVATVASFTTKAGSRILSTVTIPVSISGDSFCRIDGHCEITGNTLCKVSSTTALDKFTPGNPATCPAVTESGLYTAGN
jgi:hypothetical protein